MPVPLTVPARASQDTLLYLGTSGSPSNFGAALGRLGNIEFGGISIDVVDVSNQESTAHRKLGTLLNSNDMTAMLFWDPSVAQDDELFELIITAPPELRSWKVVWAGGLKTWYFNGYLTKFPAKADIGKELNAALTITIDGTITPA